MEAITHAGNANIRQLQNLVWLKTKGQYMRESNTLGGNATISSPILLYTKGQYMKEQNTLDDSIENNELEGQIIGLPGVKHVSILKETPNFFYPRCQFENWLAVHINVFHFINNLYRH